MSEERTIKEIEKNLTPAEKVDRHMIELGNAMKKKLAELEIKENDIEEIMNIFNEAAGGAVVNCLTLDIYSEKVAQKIGLQKSNHMLVDAVNETIVVTGNNEKMAEKNND